MYTHTYMYIYIYIVLPTISYLLSLSGVVYCSGFRATIIIIIIVIAIMTV